MDFSMADNGEFRRDTKHFDGSFDLNVGWWWLVTANHGQWWLVIVYDHFARGTLILTLRDAKSLGHKLQASEKSDR